MVALFSAAFGLAAVAQSPAPVRNDTMHLTVNTSISSAEIAPGQKLSLSFDVTPKRNMHVYAPGKHDYQVIAVKLDPQPWMKVAATTYPPSEIYYFKELDEKVETYGKPFKLVQDVTVLNTPDSEEGAGRIADQVERAARIPGVRRQGLLRADQDSGQLCPHGEMRKACLAVARAARAPAKAGPAGAVAALFVALAASLSADQAASTDIAGVLQRAGEKVTEYFARAQSIMCLEKVSLQKLAMGFGADGPARQVESELRLSWEPSPDNPTPTAARTLRQVLRVNGSPPRKKDYDNCTTPEQQDSEEQPLSLLLPSQREKYTFTYSGRDTIDRRDAIVIAYREIRKPTVDVSLVEDNEDCISFDIEGGMRGRIWIDAEHARRAEARSIDQRPDRDSAAEKSDAPRRLGSVLDDGAVGFVDPLQARDVPESGGDAGAAG